MENCQHVMLWMLTNVRSSDILSCHPAGLLYAINGPDAYGRNVDIRGYTVNPSTGSVVDIWQPKDLVSLTLHISYNLLPIFYNYVLCMHLLLLIKSLQNAY